MVTTTVISALQRIPGSGHVLKFVTPDGKKYSIHKVVSTTTYVEDGQPNPKIENFVLLDQDDS